MARPKIHPRQLNRIRFYLGRWSFSRLIAFFSGTLFVLTALLALAYHLTAGGQSYFRWYADTFSMLAGVGFQLTGSERNVASLLVHMIASFCGLLLPAIFFGSIIGKLLISRSRFVFRQRISVHYDPRHREVLAFRLYNATGTAMCKLSYEVVARIRKRRDDNSDDEYVISKTLAVAGSGKFSLMLPFVPFTIFVPLEAGDFNRRVENPHMNLATLANIQGNPLAGGKAATDLGIEALLVLIEGRSPDMQEDFVEYALFNLKDESIFEFKKFKDIRVTYPRMAASAKQHGLEETHGRATIWDGWDEFGP